MKINKGDKIILKPLDQIDKLGYPYIVPKKEKFFNSADPLIASSVFQYNSGICFRISESRYVFSTNWVAKNLTTGEIAEPEKIEKPLSEKFPEIEIVTFYTIPNSEKKFESIKEAEEYFDWKRKIDAICELPWFKLFGQELLMDVAPILVDNSEELIKILQGK